MNKKNILIISISITILIIAIIIITVLIINSKNKKEESAPEPTEEVNNSLSDEQLKTFQNFFEEKENNGFLLSEYQKPLEIDLKQVLYNGMDGQEASYEEVEAYSEKLNQHRSSDWHIYYYETEAIKELYKEKTGSDEIGDLNLRLYGWTYLPQYDRYYVWHSDTNYTKVTCLEGTDEGDGVYKIKARLMNAASEKNMIQITVKRQGDSYIFVANEFI